MLWKNVRICRVNKSSRPRLLPGLCRNKRSRVCRNGKGSNKSMNSEPSLLYFHAYFAYFTLLTLISSIFYDYSVEFVKYSTCRLLSKFEKVFNCLLMQVFRLFHQVLDL